MGNGSCNIRLVYSLRYSLSRHLFSELVVSKPLAISPLLLALIVAERLENCARYIRSLEAA